MGWLLPCFLWLVLAPAARAGVGECASVDLRDLLGAPFHQGDTGLCFAHTSADLIAAKLGFRVSPLQLATSFVLGNPEELHSPVAPEVQARVDSRFIQHWRSDRNEEPENFRPDRILTMNGIVFTGGEEEDALLLANFFGLCPEERLPSGEKAFPLYLKEIRRFHADRWRRGDIPPEEGSAPIGEVSDPQARAMAWSFRRWVERRCGEAVRPAEALLPESVRYGKTLADFQRKVASRELGAGEAQAKLAEAIDFQLDHGKPVTIGFSANDIMPKDPKVPDGDHSSVLAGRRRIGNDCFYFLRNSFGEARENDYLPPFRGRLERGGVWLRLQELPSLYSATWLR